MPAGSIISIGYPGDFFSESVSGVGSSVRLALSCFLHGGVHGGNGSNQPVFFLDEA